LYLRTFFVTCSPFIYLSIYGTFKPLSDVISKLGDVNRSTSLIVLELTVKNRPSPRHLFLVRTSSHFFFLFHFVFNFFSIYLFIYLFYLIFLFVLFLFFFISVLLFLVDFFIQHFQQVITQNSVQWSSLPRDFLRAWWLLLLWWWWCLLLLWILVSFIFSLSFHYSTYFFSIFSISFHIFPYFPYHFTIFFCVSHIPTYLYIYIFMQIINFIQLLLVIFLSWWVSNFHNQIYFT
jgi:hypothetical protein